MAPLGQLPANSLSRKREVGECDCLGSAKAGQLALASLGLGPGPPSGPGARVGCQLVSRAKLEGVGMGGLPLSPAPGHLGRDQGLRSPGSSLSQLAGDPPGPTGRCPAVGTAWHLSYRRGALPPGHGACLPPSLQAQLGGGKGPDRFLQKRANPGPHQDVPGS